MIMKQNILNSILSGVALLALAAGIQSCGIDEGDPVTITEFGAPKREFQVGWQKDTVKIKVLSSEDFTIDFVEDVDWAEIDTDGRGNALSGDSEFNVICTTNDGFPRMASILIATSERSDTLFIKQKGYKTPSIKLPNQNLAIMGDEAQITTPVQTNLLIEDMSTEIDYNGGEEGWISDLSIMNGLLIMKVAANPHEKELRRANVVLRFVDGWKKETSVKLMLTQANANNEFGAEIPFDGVKDFLGKITKDVYIEGVVISDRENGNAGENLRTTETGINRNGIATTVYIQSKDGSCGYMLKLVSPEDNIFERYSKVKLLLRDTYVELGTNPARYTIKDVKSSMVISSEAGKSSDLPVKEKYISELTDDDVYTYVTLKDCEFPIRKGPFTPINEGYGEAFDTWRITKYPLLVRDINGNSIYTYTNLACPYRRDGKMLPYGSGTISGVIVWESYDSFEWAGEPNSGDIGRYQIRHQSRSDIKFNENFEDGFSGFVTEYQYANLQERYFYPTYGNNGYLTTSIEPKEGETAVAGVEEMDYSYLGPIGREHYGNENGNGVLLPDGSKLSTSPKTNWPNYPNTSDGNKGKGMVNAEDRSAMARYADWWNTRTDRGEAWLLKVSTKDITTDHLSMQLSMINYYVGAPRYYTVDWSEHGDNTKSDWHHIAEFTMADIVQWGGTRWWQLAGFKNLDIPLPLEILGKENLWIRIGAARNMAGSTTGYDDAPVGKGKEVAISYLAIRYNK